MLDELMFTEFFKNKLSAFVLFYLFPITERWWGIFLPFSVWLRCPPLFLL